MPDHCIEKQKGKKKRIRRPAHMYLSADYTFLLSALLTAGRHAVSLQGWIYAEKG